MHKSTDRQFAETIVGAMAFIAVVGATIVGILIVGMVL